LGIPPKIHARSSISRRLTSRRTTGDLSARARMPSYVFCLSYRCHVEAASGDRNIP
jgi:hypothetical protein